MSDKTESQPTEKATVVEAKVQTEKKPNVFLAVLFTIMVMMLLFAVVGAYFLKANFKDTKEVVDSETKISKEDSTKKMTHHVKYLPKLDVRLQILDGDFSLYQQLNLVQRFLLI